MVRNRRLQRAATRAMRTAKDYEAWIEAAEALDPATGLDAWREDDESPHFHGATLRA